MSRNADEVHGRALAAWTSAPSGNVTWLCKPCLDGWLDNADDEPLLEPAQLIFVTKVGDRWCSRHGWPWELCRDWSHGPGTNTFGQHHPHCACLPCYRRRTRYAPVVGS